MTTQQVPPEAPRAPAARRRRAGAALRLLILIVVEAASVWALAAFSRMPAFHVEWGDLMGWLQRSPVEDAIPALVVRVALVPAVWSLFGTLLYCLAALTGVPALIRGTRWLALPFTRGIVERALALTASASIMMSASAGAAHAGPAGGARMAMRPPAVVAVLDPQGATVRPEVVREVQPGQSLWDVAASRVAELQGRPLAELRSVEINPYYRALVEANGTRSPSPGDMVVLPSASASVAPAAAAWVDQEVRPGDNMWSISKERLARVSGTNADDVANADVAPYWSGVVADNQGSIASGDPNLIFPGEHLRLRPVVDTDGAPAAAPNGPTPAPVAPASASAPTTAAPAPPTAAPAATAPSRATAPAVPTTAAETESPVTTAPSAAVAGSGSTSPGSVPATTPASTAVPAAADAASGPAGSSPTAVTATTSPAAATPQVQKRAKVASHRVPLAPPAVGVSSLLGGIFVWRMRREDMAAQRRRRRGRELVQQPDPVAEPVERRVRAIAEVETVHWVDATLRYASAALTEAGGGGVEGILCVRPGQLGMELVVDPPAPPVGRFDSTDDGRTWTLDPDLELSELQDLAWGQVLVPALCSVGSTPDGPVLVDLEQAGVLAVEGDPARVEGFLAGAALEMASAPWASDTSVYLLGGDERLAGRDLVQSIDDASRFVADLDQLTSLVADEDLGAAPSTLAARVAPGNVEGWFPAVVVAHPGADGDALSRLAARARPRRSGLALVGPGPLPGATWRLLLGPEGQAVLEPLGLELDSRIDADVVAALTGRIAARAEQADLAPVIDLVPEPVAVSSPTSTGDVDEEPVEGEVCFLGPLKVTWADDVDPITGPERAALLAAAVAYLGAHDDHPVPGPRLQEALWPLGRDDSDIRAGSVKGATLRSTMSRLRSALGTDSLGRPHLPPAKNGTYTLGRRYRCTWSRFQAKVAAADKASSAESIELLKEALALVRGRPFADAPPAYLAWADDSPLVSDIEVAVADAAEKLGERALQAGDPELAEWAARQGLLVVPVREDLHRVRFQAAFDAGDPDGLDAAHTEAVRAIRTHIDPAEALQEETERLYQRLKRACRPRDSQGDASGARRERTTTG